MNWFRTDTLPSRDAARAWIAAMWDAGRMYHPDDDAHEVVIDLAGTPLFTAREADLMNARMREACDLLSDDVYDLPDGVTA